MAGEVLLFFFSLPQPYIPPLWVQNSCLLLSVFLYYFVRTKEGEEGASSLLLQVWGSSWLTLLPRSEMTMKGATDPYCAPNGIYIPCLCVIPSHTLHFLSLLTYTDPTSKVKVCTKERKHFFFFGLSLCSVTMTVYFLLNLPKIEENIRLCITRQRRGREEKKKKSLKNKQRLAAFFH